MGFGRRRNWERGRRDDRKEGKARPKLAFAGAIVLAIGILFIFYGGNIVDFDTKMSVGAVTIPAGIIMLLLSMSKRNQIRFAKGMEKGMEKTKKAFETPCQCCKCTNCGRNHNHWTHD